MVATAAVTATLAAVPGAPAAADVEMYDAIVLPQSGGGDVVLLPGTRTLVVAGGDDDPVVVVDTVTREVTTVPGSVGVRSLDLSGTGQLVHGTTRTTDEVVEIDPWAELPAVTGRWTMPDACLLNDAVMRGGVIWVAQGCSDRHVRRLDPATGTITIAAEGVEGQSLVGEPGGPGIYTLMNASTATVTHQDASGGQLTQVAAREHDYFPYSSELLRISEDGGTLFVPGEASDRRDTITFDAGTLTTGPRWPQGSPALWADETTIGARFARTGAPTLLRRDGLAEVNRFLPDDAVSVTTFDARIDPGGNLLATVMVGGEKRVYVVDQPLMSEPTLALDVPWGTTGIGTPTPVEGSFTWDGEPPVEPMELVLSEVEPTRRVIGTVTTADDGTWETTWTPTSVGSHVLEVRWSGTRDSVARLRVYVDEEYRRLDLSGPATVAGGDSFEVTATATLNGQPLADTIVHLRRQDWAKPSYFEFEELGAMTTDATGTATWEVPPGAVDGYWFSAIADYPGWGHGQDYITDIRELRVEVDREDTVVTVGDLPETAAPGDPVEIPVRLTTATGEPLAGQPLRIELGNYGWPTVTTDDDGRATHVDTTTTEGWSRLRVRFAGSLTLDDSVEDTHAITRRRIPDVLTISGPTTGEVGTPASFSGTVAEAGGPVELTLDTGDGSPEQILTAADGSWTAQVVPPLHGPNWITVFFAGNTRLAPDRVSHLVTTPRATPVITINPVTAQVGSPLVVRGRIDGLLYRSPIWVSLDGGEPVERWTDGDLWFYTLEPLTEPGPLEVTFAYGGDERHEPVTETVVVDVHPAPEPEPEPAPTLHTDLRGGTYSAATAPYRVYDTGVSPRLRTTIEPQATYGCVVRVIQRLRSGRWDEVDRRCLDHAGERVLVSRLPARPARAKFRVRTELPWADDQTLTSTWSRYRFRR